MSEKNKLTKSFINNVKAIKENRLLADIISSLLDKNCGDDINAGDEEGWTALHWTCRYDQKELVSKLLKQLGIEPNTRNRVGQTAVMWAAAKASKETIQLLLTDRRVSLEIKDSDGWGIEEMIECRNTSENEQNEMKSMVIDAREQQRKLENSLKEIEITPNEQEKLTIIKNDYTFVESAVQNATKVTTDQMLTVNFASISSKLFETQGIKSAKIFRKQNLYKSSIFKTETLIKAIQSFDQSTWEPLLSQMTGLSINETNKNGWSALHEACSVNNDKAAEALLHQPDILPNIRSICWGQTPVMRAAMYCSTETIEVMMSCGRVDLDLVDNQGMRLEDLVGMGKATNIQEKENQNILRIIRIAKEKRCTVKYEIQNESIENDHSEAAEALNNAIEEKQQNLRIEATQLTKKYATQGQKLPTRHCREQIGMENKFGIEQNILETQQIFKNIKLTEKTKKVSEERLELEQENGNKTMNEELEYPVSLLGPQGEHKYVEAISKYFVSPVMSMTPPTDESLQLHNHLNMRQPPLDMWESPLNMGQSPLDICQPPSDIWQPPLDKWQPPSLIWQPLLDVCYLQMYDIHLQTYWTHLQMYGNHLQINDNHLQTYGMQPPSDVPQSSLGLWQPPTLSGQHYFNTQ